MLKRGTDALAEFNHGLTLEKLNSDPDEWARLRKFLRDGRHDMEECVVDGVTPLFGYPIVCYSPVEKQRSNKQMPSPRPAKEMLKNFLWYVFPHNSRLPTVRDVINASRQN